MATVTVRLPGEISKRLDELVKRTKRTRSSFIKEMIENSLADFEEAYVALERLNQKNAKYFSTAEVEKKLGL